MNTKELTQYLKICSELESSIYRQERSISQTIERANRKPRKEWVSKPHQEVIKEPVYKKSTEVQAKENEGFGLIFVVSIISFAGLIASISSGTLAVTMVFALLAAYDIFLILKKRKSLLAIKQEEQNKVEEMKRQYETRIDQSNREYQKALDVYKQKVKKVDAEYNKIIKRNKIVLNEVGALQVPLDETKQLLNQLYDKNIIYPKYRNMVAICTIYEYFEAGRCTELTGANGAYNLYESELRQNIIINKLDVIIDKLDQIAENQYMLYSEMKKTNEYLSSINKTVDRIYTTTKQIEENTCFAAQCAAITAENTTAIKYISLING